MIFNRKLKFISLILSLVVVAIVYQNCTLLEGDGNSRTLPSEELNAMINDPSNTDKGSGIGSGGNNGAGYTGKLRVRAPDQITEGEPYIITIDGGVAPYNITSTSGSISLLSNKGPLFELRNEFKSFDSFDLKVVDSLGEQVIVRIEIIASDNIFNFSFIRTSVFNENILVLQDKNTGFVFIFSREGLHLKTLAPEGDRLKRFDTETDMTLLPAGGIAILQKNSKELQIFDREFSFVSLVKIPTSISGRLESLALRENDLLIVESGRNVIHRYTHQGDYLGLLNLNFPARERSRIFAIGKDPRSQRIFVTDKERKSIYIFEDGYFKMEINHLVLDGETTQFIGPQYLQMSSKGQLLIQDATFKEGKNAGLERGENIGEEKTYLLSFDGESFSGNLLYSRNTGNYHEPSDCLYVNKSVLGFCNSRRYQRLIDSQTNEVEEIVPRLGQQSFMNEPREMAVNELGEVYVISDRSRISALNSDLSKKYHLGGYNKFEGFDNFTDIETSGDVLYIASSKTQRIGIFHKDSLVLQESFEVVDSRGISHSPRRLKVLGNRLFVTTRENSYLIYTLNGRLLKEGGDLLYQGSPINSQEIWARSIEFSNDGLMYLLSHEGNQVFKVDPDTNSVLNVYELEKRASTMALGPNGQMMFVIENQIYFYDMQIFKVNSVVGGPGPEPGAFNGIKDIQFFSGAIYITDYYNQRFQRIQLSDVLN